MIKNDMVILKTKSKGTQDEFGGYIQGAESTKEIDVDMQPFSRELLLKKYGYDIAVSKLMFCDFDEDIKEGSIIVYNSKNFIVKKIPWDSGHLEVVLDEL